MAENLLPFKKRIFVWYAQVQPEDVREIIESHLMGGHPVERLIQNRVPSEEPK